MSVKAVRGAAQLRRNEAGEMTDVVVALVHDILQENGIGTEHVVSILFSQTRDLDAANPAASLRTAGYAEVPLFCTQEPEYPDSMPRMLRVLVTFEAPDQRDPVPVYKGGARRLRPDLYPDESGDTG